MNYRFSLIVVAMFLIGGAGVLWWQDRAPAPPAPVDIVSTEPASPNAPAESFPPQHYVLALSWQPAFCETRPGRPECRAMRDGDAAAGQFSLHGLWPQGDEYCGVSQRLIDADSRSWNELPRVELSAATRAALDEIMPGTRSNLDRHEWIVHGTCTGATQEQYYAAAIALTRAVNSSAVGKLFAGSVGGQVTRSAIRAAFDNAFGGTGDRVRLDCTDDDDRTLALELRINLYGDAITERNLRSLMQSARTANNGCAGGIVDQSGDQ